MKRPFFPELSSDTRLSCLPGETFLVSALPVQKTAKGSDRTWLVFLRARLRLLRWKGVSSPCNRSRRGTLKCQSVITVDTKRALIVAHGLHEFRT